jgi:hypothetical protein
MKLLLHIFAFLLLSSVAVFAQGKDFYNISPKFVLARTGTHVKPPFFDVIIKHDSLQTEAKDYRDTARNLLIHKVRAGELAISVRPFGYKKIDTTLVINTDNLQPVILIPPSGCLKFNKEKALTDLNTNKILLLMQMGEVSYDYQFDDISRAIYNINYYNFGCTMSEYRDCVYEYNYEIFKYLDQKYGCEWREFTHPYTVGFKEYIAEN